MKRHSEGEDELVAKKMPPVPGKSSDIKEFVEEAIKSHTVTVFAFSTCPFCKKVGEERVEFNWAARWYMLVCPL